MICTAPLDVVQDLHYFWPKRRARIFTALPTLHRFRNVKICMYADDEALPHLHIRSPKTSCKVEIETLRLIVGHYDRVDFAEAISWAALNTPLLRQKWSELNERD